MGKTWSVWIVKWNFKSQILWLISTWFGRVNERLVTASFFSAILLNSFIVDSTTWNSYRIVTCFVHMRTTLSVKKSNDFSPPVTRDYSNTSMLTLLLSLNLYRMGEKIVIFTLVFLLALFVAFMAFFLLLRSSPSECIYKTYLQCIINSVIHAQINILPPEQCMLSFSKRCRTGYYLLWLLVSTSTTTGWSQCSDLFITTLLSVFISRLCYFFASLFDLLLLFLMWLLLFLALLESVTMLYAAYLFNQHRSQTWPFSFDIISTLLMASLVSIHSVLFLHKKMFRFLEQSGDDCMFSANKTKT